MILHSVASWLLGFLLSYPYGWFAHQGKFVPFGITAVVFTFLYILLSSFCFEKRNIVVLWNGVIAATILLSVGQWHAFSSEKARDQSLSFYDYTEKRVEEGFYQRPESAPHPSRHTKGAGVWAAWVFQALVLYGLVYAVHRALSDSPGPEEPHTTVQLSDKFDRPTRYHPGEPPPDLTTQLFHAIAQKDLAWANDALQSGADQNSKNSFDETPLELACRYGPPEMVEMLLDSGAEPTPDSERERISPLHTLVANESIHQLLEKMVEKGADVNKRGFRGATPIFEAAQRADWRIAERLLHCGANPLLKTDLDENLFHALVHYPLGNKENDQEKRLVFSRNLLECGLSATDQDSRGNTPLHHSQRMGTKLSQFFLEQGCSPDLKNNSGSTPLQAAAIAENRDVAFQLLAHGAQLDLLSAIALNRREDVERFCRQDTDQVNKTLSPFSTSPLGLAIVRKYYDFIPMLLKAGANPNGDSAYGPSLIALIRTEGEIEVAKLLIANGAFLDQTDGDRNSALMYAVGVGNREWCELLLQNGANPDIQNERGSSPRAAIIAMGLEESIRAS